MVAILPKGVITHRRDQCDGAACCIHNPSPHPMRTWTIFIRLDKLALAERICLHGIGHPDPDSIAFIRRQTTQSIGDAMLVHGCDGCCHGSYQ